jgi:two-component system alkaline phosphatase synthesis response regulator PhoP
MDDKRLILHIDDEYEILELVAEILRHPQLTFMGALDGPEGLKLASEHRPDLILLDIMLPDMDGREVYARLRSSPVTADIPVVMLTAKSRPYEVIRARTIEGLGGYIGKPFDVSELRKEIAAQLGITY